MGGTGLTDAGSEELLVDAETHFTASSAFHAARNPHLRALYHAETSRDTAPSRTVHNARTPPSTQQRHSAVTPTTFDRRLKGIGARDPARLVHPSAARGTRTNIYESACLRRNYCNASHLRINTWTR